MPSLPSSESISGSTSKSEIHLVANSVVHVDLQGRINQSRKGVRFWMVFVAICVSLFLSALEFTSVAPTLPTIAHDLNGDDFVWVASAYALASTALLPATGGMAEVFGRRVTMLLSLFLFALGSALCGAAQTMNWLIAARTVQGAGGGGILSLSSIILSDMVPLRERAMYNGMIGFTWGCAASIGPLVGGALAEAGRWRWLFYLNIPVAGIAAILVLVFMNLRTPQGSFKEKFSRMDLMGNAIIISSSAACIIGLTWGGVRYPWLSPHVLVPLIVGLLGIVAFLFYEVLVAKEPLVPYTLLSNRTSLSGYIQTFVVPVVILALIYYLPLYYQACKGASPIRAGVDLLGLCMSLGPALILTGASIQITKSYRVQLWLGWSILMVAMGILTTFTADTPLSHSVFLPILVSAGAGMVYASTYFPVLAPLPVSENARALAFFNFLRSFAGVWGVTIGTAVLQTQLTKRLPTEFLAEFPGGVSVAYAAVPVIYTLPEPVQSSVREAFASSISVIWQVMIGISAIGLLASFAMRAVPLHTEIDEKWGLEEHETNREAFEL